MNTTTPRFNYTGYGTQGDKYSDKLTTTEIAKLIRSEIKSKFPNIKTSVTSKYYSGGSSINVKIKFVPFAVYKPEYISSYKKAVASNNWTDVRMFDRDPYTMEYNDLVRIIKNIGNQYNYDDSDAQIDYFHTNFYFFVGLDWNYEKTLKA
jgi:hypothetical protein